MLIKQYTVVGPKAECVVFANGQAAYITEEQFFYLNDIVYIPKYQDMAVFNVIDQQLKVRLKDILSLQEMFMPIDFLQVKTVLVQGEKTTVIAAIVRNYMFLFQASPKTCELFFVFEYNKDQKIEHCKMRKEGDKLWILVVLNGGGIILPSLIDITYDKLVLNMTYECQPITEAMLTNHLTSLNFDGNWFLSIGHVLYQLDFQRQKADVIFETDSLLSPIVNLSKVKKSAEETIIMAVTLDNRVYKIGNDVQQEHLQLAVNCVGLSKVSKKQSFPLFVGLGNTN